MCPIDKSMLLANVKLSCQLLHYSGRIVDVENLVLIQVLKMMKCTWRKKTNRIIFWLFDYYSSCHYPTNLKVLQLFFKHHLCSIDKSTLLATVWLSCQLLHYSVRTVDVQNLGLIQALKMLKCMWLKKTNCIISWLFGHYCSCHYPINIKNFNFSLSIIRALLINLSFWQMFNSAVNHYIILAGLFM